MTDINSKNFQSQRLVAGFAMQMKKRTLELSGGVNYVVACVESAINSTNIEFLWRKERGQNLEKRSEFGFVKLFRASNKIKCFCILPIRRTIIQFSSK